MRHTLLWTLAIALVVFAACKSTEDPPAQNTTNNNGGGDTTQIEICDTLEATYDANVGGIIDMHCATSGCHTGSFPANGLNLSTYADVKNAAQKPSFLASIKHEDGQVPMPYAMDKLQDSVIQVLECWVNKDFPEN